MSATVISEKIIRPKRFIAGARCPQCRQVDKTVTYVVERILRLADQALSTQQDEIMACVSCGYQQAKSALTTGVSEVLESDLTEKISGKTPHKIDIQPLQE